MSYYPKGHRSDAGDDVDDFDDYDPSPYGGGYDIALTYGRPLPPSEEICYPATSTSSSGFDYEASNYSSYAEPTAYGQEALDNEYKNYVRRKPHQSGGGGSGYDRHEQPTSEYGSGYGRRPDEPEPTSEYGSGYGRRHEEPTSEYGSGYGRKHEDPTPEYGSGYGHRQEEYGSGYGRRPEEPVSEYVSGYGRGRRNRILDMVVVRRNRTQNTDLVMGVDRRTRILDMDLVMGVGRRSRILDMDLVMDVDRRNMDLVMDVGRRSLIRNTDLAMVVGRRNQNPNMDLVMVAGRILLRDMSGGLTMVRNSLKNAMVVVGKMNIRGLVTEGVMMRMKAMVAIRNMEMMVLMRMMRGRNIGTSTTANTMMIEDWFYD